MKTEQVNQHLVGMSYNDIVPKLSVVEDQGDCCGYSSCEQKEVIPSHVDVNNLVLKDCVRISYEDEEDNYASGSRSVLNFVFTDGNGDLILGYELSAGSGSGWEYGAWVELRLEDTALASESW